MRLVWMCFGLLLALSGCSGAPGDLEPGTAHEDGGTSVPMGDAGSQASDSGHGHLQGTAIDTTAIQASDDGGGSEARDSGNTTTPDAEPDAQPSTVAQTAPLAMPVFTPQAGSYQGSVTVSISAPSAPTSVVVYYTTNGANPTPASSVYEGPFLVTSNATVRAYAHSSGYQDSSIAEAQYAIASVTAPASCNATDCTNPCDGFRCCTSAGVCGCAANFTDTCI
jgi:hypothetical protein